MTASLLSKTKFASAGRASQITIQRQAAYIESISLLKPLLDAMPNAVMILNEQHQIVYANRQFAEYFQSSDKLTSQGLRLGEAVHCVHSFDLPAGCGTSEACQICGAVLAILTAQKGHRAVRDCHISTEKDGVSEALDLRISATPFALDGHEFILVAAEDISHEKRRQVLERIFYHDIVNTTGAIIGLADLMQATTDPGELINLEFAGQFAEAGHRLLDEITAQQQLLAAELGELKVQPAPFDTVDFLETIVDLYQEHLVADGRFLQLYSESEAITIWSDQALLGRVVANMTKNALEASAPGDTVTLGCDNDHDYLRIWVHNPQPMPRRVQLQIFQRSFSTKGDSRGLGTYSMKLLSERYLQGRVSFESNEEAGTTFSVMIPMEWAAFPEEPELTAVARNGTQTPVPCPCD